MTEEIQGNTELPAVAPENVTPSTEQGTAPVAEPIKPEKTFTQAELDEILEKRLAKERRKHQSLSTERDLFKKLALERGEPLPQKPKAEEPQRPKLDDFNGDWEKYTEAIADYKAEQKFTQRDAERQREYEQRAQQESLAKARDTHLEREAKARDKYEDYDEVARNPSLPINQVMANTILMSDVGPELVYYLGNNLDEANRIARLPPLLAVKEMGKLEVKVSAAPVRKSVTKAPDPITPVSGKGGSVISDDPLDTDDIDTWRRKREAQIRKKAGK